MGFAPACATRADGDPRRTTLRCPWSPSCETHQGWCECPPFCPREVGPLACGVRLDAHVVGAGVEVRLDASGDGRLVAPRHHVVDEPVAAPVGEVLLGNSPEVLL